MLSIEDQIRYCNEERKKTQDEIDRLGQWYTDASIRLVNLNNKCEELKKIVPATAGGTRKRYSKSKRQNKSKKHSKSKRHSKSKK